MIDRVDQKLGELIALLKRRGELDHTVFFFFSDNGGTPTTYRSYTNAFHPWGETRNTPCSKQKGFTHEGGIRSPFIMAWPGRTQPGAINRGQVGHVMDILPTCLDLAGAEYPKALPGRHIEPIEGLSLWPAASDPSHAAPRTLFWEFSGSGAVRDGDWKLVREFTDQYFGKGEATERTGQWHLYNVRTDPGEIRDLIAEHPEKARELEARYLAWEKRVGVVPHEEIKARQAAFKAGSQAAQ
jgi:arylsulfatase